MGGGFEEESAKSASVLLLLLLMLLLLLLLFLAGGLGAAHDVGGDGRLRLEVGAAHVTMEEICKRGKLVKKTVVCGVTKWLPRLLALRIGIWFDSRWDTLWMAFLLSYSD
jgi:hypothetical protein